ncbi:NAD(P)-binding domain-containing protein [Acidovorax sp. Be4]|uniref:NAD(P)-binding domain-containing protein n=1 Tax=Acidovorax bellezanensis TaxID=2976702 RepID=A0ABT2PQK6_9BURK|nr:NAD(P)-binding domain-containing protein [Acidovorax sp. Be4]MCT9812555.1 NAD(P)-binding domain-containing protein [Acidovorax sp. Be4]
MSPTADVDDSARQALRLLGPAPDNWVPDRPGLDYNAVVVGAGQGGCAFAFALRRAGIGRVLHIDAAPEAAQAGIWRTRARMHSLRTAKNLVGPELDVGALGFQAWYEARHGRDAYAALPRIPRTDWADYLHWFQQFLQLPVQYGTQLRDIAPLPDQAATGLRLQLRVNGQSREITTRKLILATGNAGSGGPSIPHALQAIRGAGLAAHTADDIDFAALAGKQVAVVGAAASAFDAAAVALEAGAAAVHLFARRDHIAARAVAKPRAYAGFYDHFHALPDALRWRHALRLRRAGTTPPADSLQRALAHPQFHLHLGAPWDSAQVERNQVVARVGDQAHAFDFVIAGTGYSNDPSQRAELARIAPLIARWSDRFTPQREEEDAVLGLQPYLSASLAFTQKTPGSAPWLGAIHVFNPSGAINAGGPLGDVPSMKRDIPAAVRGISSDLFLADLALHEDRAHVAVAPDFGPDLYAHALWPMPPGRD